jgi:hypothetical protein
VLIWYIFNRVSYVVPRKKSGISGVNVFQIKTTFGLIRVNCLPLFELR